MFSEKKPNRQVNGEFNSVPWKSKNKMASDKPNLC